MTIQAMKRAKAFSENSILQEDLERILKAGVNTVNQLDRQSWKFVAITDASVLDKIDADTQYVFADTEDNDTISAQIMEKVEEITGGLSDDPGINDAPVAIVIYADDSTGSPNADFDCGAAAQNMMHAAYAMGYGATLIPSPLGVLNGEDHDTWCMQFGVDSKMDAVAVLLIGTASQTSSLEYDIDELMIEKVSYVQ